MKKLLMVIICIVVVITVTLTNIYTYAADFTPTLPNAGDVPDKLEKKTQEIWATVVFIVRIVAVACVVFAGIRYMFASSDQRADIKQGLIYLSIGAVLIFGATIIIPIVVQIVNDWTTGI